MAEWSKAAVLKTEAPSSGGPGFESPPLRFSCMEKNMDHISEDLEPFLERDLNPAQIEKVQSQIDSRGCSSCGGDLELLGPAHARDGENFEGEDQYTQTSMYILECQRLGCKEAVDWKDLFEAKDKTVGFVRAENRLDRAIKSGADESTLDELAERAESLREETEIARFFKGGQMGLKETSS